MPSRHAILGPSKAHEWLTCAPSARFAQQIVEAPSLWAEEGTFAHDLGAAILRLFVAEWHETQYQAESARIADEVIAFYTVNYDVFKLDPYVGYNAMYEYALGYANFVYAIGGEIWIEREYDLSKFVPLSFGTGDAVNVFNDTLYITDLKYGTGKHVSAVDNPQLKLYGLGALLEAIAKGYKPTEVVLTIYQPRVGAPSTWSISVADLLVWAETDVAPMAALAIAGDGEFVAGDHCLFCKAKTRCMAYYDKFGEIRGIHDKRAMSPEDYATVLKYGPLIEGWLEKVREQAVKDMQLKKVIPGFKLVRGSGRGAYVNDDDIIDALIGEGYDSEAIFTTELIGLTALKALVGPSRFEDVFKPLTYTKEGKPQIKPLSDPKQAIDASAADEYESEDLT